MFQIFSKQIPSAITKELKPVDSVSAKYHYRRRALLMTLAENKFFKILDDILGRDYYIFPQVHLSALFEHRIIGQDWEWARRHIGSKSVDFVICDPDTVQPLFAIELDDWSHDMDSRKLRDAEVERIFRDTGLELLRYRPHGVYSKLDVMNFIKDSKVLKRPRH